MSEPAGSEDKHYTYADLKKFPEGERWEIIDGVPYNMSAAPVRKHQAVSIRLASLLLSLTDDQGCHTYDAPFDVRLPDGSDGDDETDTVVQPDIVVVCDETKLDDAGCRGAPELVVEILSPATSYKDQTEKLALYERTGVLEYWVVNPEAAWVAAYQREPVPGSGADETRFAKPAYYRGDESIDVGVLSGAAVDLKRVFKE